MLERPLQEVLASGAPDFPFCLGWANETWTGIWHGASDRILVEQTYGGPEDDAAHFFAIAPALADPRYLTVAGKKLVLVYKPQQLPEPARFVERWRQLAQKEGIGELFFVGAAQTPELLDSGFDGFVAHAPGVQLKPLQPLPAQTGWQARWARRRGRAREGPAVYRYADLVASHLSQPLHPREFPIALPNWDNTPRSGRGGVVLADPTPEQFGVMMGKAIAAVAERPPTERLVFIKSWNEWAEGNYLEPSRRYGRGYLEAVLDRVRL